MEYYSIQLQEMKSQCQIQTETDQKAASTEIEQAIMGYSSSAAKKVDVDRPRTKTQQQDQLKCPRCDSTNTKFCYYNNYSLSQPRYFCKACRRYWTHGGSLRNIPIGGGCRKNKRSSSSKRFNMHAQTHLGLSSLLEINAIHNNNANNTSCSNILSSTGLPTFFDLLMGGFLESSNNNYTAPDWYPPVQQQQVAAAPFGEVLTGAMPAPAVDEEMWRNVTMGMQCLDQDGSTSLMGSMDVLGRDCCVGSTLHSLLG